MVARTAAARFKPSLAVSSRFPTKIGSAVAVDYVRSRPFHINGLKCSNNVSSHNTPTASSSVHTHSNEISPKSKAQSIVDALPGNSLVSKTAIVSAGAALSLAAISNELYVVNEESVVAFSLLTIFYAISKKIGPLYGSWAQSRIDTVSNILKTARENHANAVQERIQEVKGYENVVDITKTLFEMSKETAKLEAQAFELEQKTLLAAESKKVLDSWVRYQGQLKEAQQREISQNVIANVEKELKNPKILKQILDQSVADVEKIFRKN